MSSQHTIETVSKLRQTITDIVTKKDFSCLDALNLSAKPRSAIEQVLRISIEKVSADVFPQMPNLFSILTENTFFNSFDLHQLRKNKVLNVVKGNKRTYQFHPDFVRHIMGEEVPVSDLALGSAEVCADLLTRFSPQAIKERRVFEVLFNKKDKDYKFLFTAETNRQMMQDLKIPGSKKIYAYISHMAEIGLLTKERLSQGKGMILTFIVPSGIGVIKESEIQKPSELLKETPAVVLPVVKQTNSLVRALAPFEKSASDISLEIDDFKRQIETYEVEIQRYKNEVERRMGEVEQLKKELYVRMQFVEDVEQLKNKYKKGEMSEGN